MATHEYEKLFKTSDIVSTFNDIGWDDFKKFIVDIDLTEVYKLADVGRNTERQRVVFDGLLNDPSIHQIVEQRYLGEQPDLNELSRLPEGTIGHAFAKWYNELGFTLDFFAKIPIANDHAYIEYRLRQTHDLWHLATGIDTSFAGEMGLQAFMFSQLQYPVAAVFLSAAMLRCIDHPEEVDDVFALIIQGWQIGKSAKPLLAVRWEEDWGRRLTDIRASLNLPQQGINLVI